MTTSDGDRHGWLLHFYTSDWVLAPIDDLVPDLRGVDVAAWARRNGARDGTPFLIGPDERLDVVVNGFWRDPMFVAWPRAPCAATGSR